MAWVVADVSITGGIYPLLNATILALLGPVSAVLFTSISTVSGLLAIPLNFMRLRLLKQHSTLDIVVSAVSVVGAIVVIFVCEFLGVFEYIFAQAWTLEATLVPLFIACLWRAASLATTIPFAALRRMGQAKLLTVLRASVAVVTFGGALAVIALNSLSWIFAVLLAGELLQALLYEIARRRQVARRHCGGGLVTRVLVDLLFYTGKRGGMESYVRNLYRELGTVESGLEFVGYASTELAASDTSWFPGEVVDSGISGENRISWVRGELAAVTACGPATRRRPHPLPGEHRSAAFGGPRRADRPRPASLPASGMGARAVRSRAPRAGARGRAIGRPRAHGEPGIR